MDLKDTPATTYGSECWAIKKKDRNKLKSAAMRMLRWARGKTRLDHIRNEDIRKEAHVKHVETFLENKRLKWFGHCILETKTQPYDLCNIAKPGSFGEKEQRSTEKEMEGLEEIPTDGRHGRIHSQLQGSSARPSHFLDAETCEFPSLSMLPV